MKLPASTFKFVQVFLQKPGRFVERLVVDVSFAGESDSGTGSSLILINRQAQTDRGWNCAASSSAFRSSRLWTDCGFLSSQHPPISSQEGSGKLCS